jgi:hypothetical protein
MATLRVRRPREFADGLDDRILVTARRGFPTPKATTARRLSRSGRGEPAASVCLLAASALVAEFVRLGKLSLPGLAPTSWLLCIGRHHLQVRLRGGSFHAGRAREQPAPSRPRA